MKYKFYSVLEYIYIHITCHEYASVIRTLVRNKLSVITA